MAPRACPTALGRPVAFARTAGQCIDLTMAPGLVERVKLRRLLADKGCDSSQFWTPSTEAACEAVLPSNRSRPQALAYDKETCEARCEAVRTIGRLKPSRRTVARHDKALCNDAAVAAIGRLWLWLRR